MQRGVRSTALALGLLLGVLPASGVHAEGLAMRFVTQSELVRYIDPQRAVVPPPMMAIFGPLFFALALRDLGGGESFFAVVLVVCLALLLLFRALAMGVDS